MPISADQRERLNRLMNERRLELGITWREVAARSGRSYEALRQLRTGPGGVGELASVQYSRALEWEPYSIRDVLAGGDPAVAAMGRPGKDAPLQPECEFERRLLARLAREMPDLPDEAKRIMLQAHRDIGHDDSCRSPAQDGQLEAGLAARSA